MHKKVRKACFIWVQQNSMAADVKPMPDAQAIYGLIRNTETYEIRILLYKQPPNCAHTMTYVSTYSRHTKNRNGANLQLRHALRAGGVIIPLP